MYFKRAPYLYPMFIRQVKKQRNPDSRVFFQYNLVQSSRIDGKARQHIVLYLGSDHLLADADNRKVVLEILKSKIYRQPELFPENPSPELEKLAEKYYQQYLVKYPGHGKAVTGPPRAPSLPPDPQKATYEQVDVSSVECTDSRTFGCEYLCTRVLEKLGIGDYLKTLEWDADERKLALVGIAARAIFSASEYKTSQYLVDNSDLLACLSWEGAQVSHKQLYRIADKLYEEKENLDRYIHERVSHLFNLDNKLVIFDLSNTYFESRKDHSCLAQYGRSKEKRHDCKQVVFSGVVNAEGFIRHSRIYEGNTPDTGTMGDMLDDLEKNSGGMRGKTVVIDAGIATQENLDLIAARGYKYVCVARSKLREYESAIVGEKTVALTKGDKNRVELRLIKPENGGGDTWLYVRSDDKALKEQSMDDKLRNRFVQEMEQVRDGIHKKGGTKALTKVWERIGRIKQKYPSIARHYEITVTQGKDTDNTGRKNVPPPVTDISWAEKQASGKGTQHGVYFIRTNYENIREKELWDIYNTIREVEATFRCLKSDLNIRPVHHQKDSRITSHIYLTILAYQLVNTIRHTLKQAGIRYDWSNIVRIMSTHMIQTIVLPTPTKDIYLRKPAQPMEKVQEIYRATKTDKTMTPTVKYVVYH